MLHLSVLRGQRITVTVQVSDSSLEVVDFVVEDFVVFVDCSLDINEVLAGGQRLGVVLVV